MPDLDAVHAGTWRQLLLYIMYLAVCDGDLFGASISNDRGLALLHLEYDTALSCRAK